MHTWYSACDLRSVNPVNPPLSRSTAASCMSMPLTTSLIMPLIMSLILLYARRRSGLEPVVDPSLTWTGRLETVTLWSAYNDSEIT